MVCPPWDLLSGSLSFSNERILHALMSLDDRHDLGEEESTVPPDEESNDEDAPEELAVEESEEEDASSEEEDEEEEVDPGPWRDTEAWKAVLEPTTPKTKLTIAHKFLTATGWEVGTIKSKCRGAWAVKYPSEQQQYVHDLNMAEYGPDRVWLVVSRVNS